MPDFTKLAAYLDSFDKDSADYDVAQYIKSKIASDLQDRNTVNNGSDEDLDDNDITMSTPDQQTQKNQEGEEMHGAFKELEVMNQLKEEKEEVKIPGEKDENGNTKLDVSTEETFGDNVLNRKNASLFEVLQQKLKR
jgi:hypothetical protein